MKEMLTHEFKVLRLTPFTPPRRRAGDVLLARVDLIDPAVNLLLIDCELRRVEGFREAYVRIPDLSVLLRYALEPGEFDFDAALRQVHFAVCRYFGLSVHAAAHGGEVLFDFLVSPAWKEWLGAHRQIATTKDAIKAYMQCGAG